MSGWQAKPFRAGAVPIELQNEASVVYFFDESQRKAIKKTPLGREGSDASEAAIGRLAKNKLVLRFLVTRDATVQGFVAIGLPPDAGELASAVWKTPQRAVLSLPSGQLRIETASSLSLGPSSIGWG